MKKIIAYIKDNIITGIIVIVPIAVIGIILTDVIKKLFAATKPLTSIMTFGGPLIESIIAAILMVAILGIIFFISGLILKSYFGRRFKKWLEKTILENIPFFNTISGAVHHLTGRKKGDYAVVEVDLYGNNTRLIGLLTETLSDGRLVIYIPFAPVINIGQVHVVANENVKILDISLRDATDIITKIGFESNKVYKEK
jgi:uncharacterized membrane protein